MPGPTIVDVSLANLDELRCCGISNPAHPGRIAKNRWLRRYLPRGVRAKVLVVDDGRQCGYIEYAPGELAWRGVEAPGYMFIHCVWVHQRAYQRQGWGGRLIEAAVEDAREAGMSGVATLARGSPWCAGSAIFLAHGFAVVETAPPDYQLLARKFEAARPDPSFIRGYEAKLAKYKDGLTIIHADQCPYTVKFTAEIAETSAREYGLTPHLVRLRNAREARNAPTPYAVFAVVRDGALVADHQISRTRFWNLMKP